MSGNEIDVAVLGGLAASHRTEQPHLTRPSRDQRAASPADSQHRRNSPTRTPGSASVTATKPTLPAAPLPQAASSKHPPRGPGGRTRSSTTLGPGRHVVAAQSDLSRPDEDVVLMRLPPQIGLLSTLPPPASRSKLTSSASDDRPLPQAALRPGRCRSHRRRPAPPQRLRPRRHDEKPPRGASRADVARPTEPNGACARPGASCAWPRCAIISPVMGAADRRAGRSQ